MSINISPSLSYQACKRCIVDTTVPGVHFDDHGVCNFCHVHDTMEKEFPLNKEGEEKLQKIISGIKTGRKNKKYDCVLGISGGRDSMFTLHYTKKILGLNPLAVHFNDGFGNPVAGENMIKGCKTLGVELRTITSDWRESKDLRISFLKASTPDLGTPTDIGIATALYGVAAKENVKYILIGQSFRTEGIMPLSWNYLDGKYQEAVHKQFGTMQIRKWSPSDPGFNLGLKEMFYYAVQRRIRAIPILYYVNYVRKDVDTLLKEELDWVNPGAHYFDDLYQALLTYVFRVKFNINRRLINYSALVRSGQMSREEALEKSKQAYAIEDPKIIDLCIKRLGLTEQEFNGYMKLAPKTFRDYPNSYELIKKFKLPIRILSKLNVLPGSAYDKYFNCGE